MFFFSYTNKKNGEKVKDYFWGSLGEASWIYNCSWCLKQTRGKICILIYINVK